MEEPRKVEMLKTWCLRNKAVGDKQNQPNRKVLWDATSKVA